MKSVKTFVIAVALGLAGVVYVAGGSQASTQSYGLKADCCVAGANCCTGEACCVTHESK